MMQNGVHMLTDLSEYGIKYPNLVADIINFFADTEIHSTSYKGLKVALGDGLAAKQAKSPEDFMLEFSKNRRKYFEITDNGRELFLQPRTISKICEILCENDIINRVMPRGFNLIFEYGYYMRSGPKIDNPLVIEYLNNMVYGFKYMYETAKKGVLPVHISKDGNSYTGTCFLTNLGIVTAKHCIEDCESVYIPGIDIGVLQNSEIKTLDGVDIVVIVPKKFNPEKYFAVGNGNVLDEIMVLGYPNHAGFDKFMTATTGQIAAIEKPYLCAYKTMLLTGKIKGGNSGGPVLDKCGYVVGVVTENQASEGDYDQFGYGMAIPSSYIRLILAKGQSYDVKVNFVNVSH